MRVTRRRIVAAIVAVAIVIVAWAPAVIADHVADGPGGAEVGVARLDRGWEFVYHAVRLSRGARLGTHDAALDLARDELWVGAPAVARSVRLVYLDGRPFVVPVPPGGTAPAARKRVAAPLSRLGWVVRGPVRGGPDQMIGLLDYASGRVAWDIRRLPPVAP